MFTQKTVGRLLVAVLAIVLSLVVAAPAAQAETTTAPPTLTITSQEYEGKLVEHIVVPMKFDDATTNNTTVGNCGAAWIDIYDDGPGDKVARVQWGMTSYQGVMVYRSLRIDFAFTTQDQGIVQGALGDSGIMFSPYYQATANATTPLPSALAVLLTGGVTLLNGSGCTLIPPRDFKGIS